ncbi:hypothetical protein Tco_1445473 [Tanacetum coccineum]
MVKNKVKVLMALANDENVAVGKETARNGDWVKISMRKVHTLLDMEENDDGKSFLDYLCIDLNYVKEQRNDLVIELKELTAITETWLNSSNKVNQCISEQIPSQKKRILGLDQLTKDPSSSGKIDLVFVKSSVDQKKCPFQVFNDPVAITDSIATEYDLADESLVCSTPLPLLEKLAGAEPISGPKTIKSILKCNSTFKPETLKGVIINEPSSAPAKGNKNVSASKRNSAPIGKLKNVKVEDDIPLYIVIKELNDL